MPARFNLTDAISLLVNQRKERFAFEKHVALMTFGTWLYYPDDADVLDHAKILAAAACFLDSGGKANQIATPANLSVALLDPPLIGSLVDLSESSVNLANAATDIVSFFLCCPPERRPSLNKAVFFVEKGGFKYPDKPELHSDTDARSVSTLKIAWKERAITAPFHWAIAVQGPSSLYEILPDETGAYKRASKILASGELPDFFGVARFVQERLLALLDPASKRHFKFTKFPAAVKPVECEFTKFDDRQIDVLSKYRAPAPSY